ncbi:MAG: spore cortex biosynthesis protein YabQ [Peptococcaceae bacterium]|nr:spore cortex biosynthesis protein YabQ [Peptococcaceae bacterium]
MESLYSQARAFLITIGIGAAAGFCFDYYRIVRRAFRLKKIGTCIGDAMFWLVTTVIVFTALLWGNWGEVRLYVMIGLGLGALLYFNLFSRPASRVIRFKFFMLYKCWTLLKKAISLLYMTVLFPFRLVIYVLSYPFYFVKMLLKKTKSKLSVFFRRFTGGKIERVRRWIKSKLKWPAFRNRKE